jgi:hypothetical protein
MWLKRDVLRGYSGNKQPRRFPFVLHGSGAFSYCACCSTSCCCRAVAAICCSRPKLWTWRQCTHTTRPLSPRPQGLRVMHLLSTVACRQHLRTRKPTLLLTDLYSKWHNARGCFFALQAMHALDAHVKELLPLAMPAMQGCIKAHNSCMVQAALVSHSCGQY